MIDEEKKFLGRDFVPARKDSSDEEHLGQNTYGRWQGANRYLSSDKLSCQYNTSYRESAVSFAMNPTADIGVLPNRRFLTVQGETDSFEPLLHWHVGRKCTSCPFLAVSFTLVTQTAPVNC